MYPNILRVVPRPRGLGGVARVAAGLGAWVVDKPWGLSPSIIPGQPRPYQNMVRTMLPRSQHPRLLNVDYRVVAGGSWPRLLPANSPVFRTPVMAPGAQAVNEALPGDPVARGVAGYGWVPMGVAHPPYFLAEKGSGMSGYGANSTTLSAADQKWLEDNPGKVQKAIRDTAVAYASLRAQANTFNVLYQSLAKADAVLSAGAGFSDADARARAVQLIYGSEAKKNEADTTLRRMGAAASRVQGMAEAEGLTLSGSLSVLASRPGEAPSGLKAGDTPSGVKGFGVVVTATIAISIAVVSVTALLGTAYVISSFNEANIVAAKAQMENQRATAASTKAGSQVLADLYNQLPNASPAEAARINAAIQQITTSMALVAQHNADVSGLAGEIDWTKVAMIGGIGVFVWWMLGKPFWKGARRSLDTAVSQMGIPTAFARDED